MQHNTSENNTCEIWAQSGGVTSVASTFRKTMTILKLESTGMHLDRQNTTHCRIHMHMSRAKLVIANSSLMTVISVLTRALPSSGYLRFRRFELSLTQATSNDALPQTQLNHKTLATMLASTQLSQQHDRKTTFDKTSLASHDN